MTINTIIICNTAKIVFLSSYNYFNLLSFAKQKSVLSNYMENIKCLNKCFFTMIRIENVLEPAKIMF